MKGLQVTRYAPDMADKWDAFVMERSQNGTFLQTRRFLSYHPKGRFEDASCMVARENGELLAVVPAARCEREGRPFLRSHPGSSFGGIVLDRHIRDAGKLLEILSALEEDWRGRYAGVELRTTPALLAPGGDALLDYCLFHEGYARECELATYVPLQGRAVEELRRQYSYNKRADLKKCLSRGLSAFELRSDDELRAFHALLKLNLEKFGASPVHTPEELISFKNERLRDEISFLGVRDETGALVAAACLFFFRSANVLHTQYLATDTRIKDYAPSAFLYDSVFQEGMRRGAAALSLGTSTFEHGHVLNAGLIQSKENYGASHALNLIFTKLY